MQSEEEISYSTLFKTYSTDLLQFRHLGRDDVNNGLWETLQNLTIAPQLDTDKYQQIFDKMQNDPINKYIIIVLEDTKTNKIIATGTILIEKHITGKIGHVENIVVNKSHEGQGIGSKIMKLLDDIGLKLEKVQKISLFTKPNTVKFYEKLGYILDGEELFNSGIQKSYI